MIDETIVDAGPTRTLGDFQAFAKRALEGTALDPEEVVEPTEAAPDPGIGGVFAHASAQLTTELLLNHGEHLGDAIRDVLYGLVGIAAEYKLDIEQIVDAGVREYERREEQSVMMRELQDEFLRLLGEQGSDQIAGDSGTLEF